VNTPPPKSAGFKLRLKAGLVGPLGRLGNSCSIPASPGGPMRCCLQLTMTCASLRVAAKRAERKRDENSDRRREPCDRPAAGSSPESEPASGIRTVIRPEHNTTAEIGVKTRLFGQRLLLNADVYETMVRDFQTNVVDSGPGALRGYLANIDKVRVEGAELDAAFAVTEHLTGHLSAAYADGKYVSYKNGPCPLELIGSTTTVCDLTGKALSALPRWVESLGGEYVHHANVGRLEGEAYLQAELQTRAKMFGEPSDSRFAVIDGYSMVNASLGFRQRGPWEVALFVRNLFDKDYMQNLTVQAGNSGLIVGTPSDPRTYGLTVRAKF
jgi:iron complex outermembrane recepter protein